MKAYLEIVEVRGREIMDSRGTQPSKQKSS